VFLEAATKTGEGPAMNVKIEIDCTPQEARAFLGLPDVEPLNAHLVQEMTKQIDANIHMLQPEELLKTWTAFGLQAQDQFQKLMTAAAGGTTGAAGRK
jgi:Family of unknown function (DUF6489)